MDAKHETDIDDAQLAAQARAAAEALFGVGVGESSGVVHVAATVRAANGRLHVLVIGPHAPKSASDFFALNLARARADAVLTSAENVRREPLLSHQLAGPAALPLTALRRTLGKRQPPLCAILSASGNLPLEHPVWSDGTPKVVLTSPATSAKLTAQLGARAQVVGLSDLTPRSAVAWLQERVRSISIEAGPSTSRQLYGEPSLVSELLLSRFEGELEQAGIGGVLAADEVLFRGLTCVHEVRREEDSGPWTFQRWRLKGEL